MLFSIIIPVYNYSQYVEKTIDSVLSQRFKNWELIVINDGSTDNSDEVISRKLLSSKDCFQYISKSNEGLAATRNLGISLAKGEYLLFLDADDELCDGALEAFEQFIKTKPQSKLIAGQHINIYPDDREKHVVRKSIPKQKSIAFKAYLHHKFSLMSSATLLHRDVFKNILYCPDLHMNEDIPVFALTLALFETYTLNHPIVKMRKHDKSMRRQVNLTLNTGFKVVNELFNHPALPQELKRHQKRYYAIRALSIARTCFSSRQLKTGRQYYCKALKFDLFYSVKWQFLRKFLRSFFLKLS